MQRQEPYLLYYFSDPLFILFYTQNSLGGFEVLCSSKHILLILFYFCKECYWPFYGDHTELLLVLILSLPVCLHACSFFPDLLRGRGMEVIL